LKFFSSTIFFMAIMGLLAAPTHARDSVLRIGFSEHPPAKILNAHGLPDGADIRLLRALTEQLDLKLEFHHVPFKRGLKMMENGEIDLMTGVLKRPDREKYLHFIEPAYKNKSNKIFFVLKGNEHLITRHEDLRTLRIGTGLGASYYPEFDNDKRIRKDPVANADLNIRMLLAERIDAFIMTESAGDYRIARLGLSDKITKADFAHRDQQNVYMVLSKKSVFAHRLGEFNEIMNNLIQDGTADQIRTHFLKTAEESR